MSRLEVVYSMSGWVRAYIFKLLCEVDVLMLNPLYEIFTRKCLGEN